MLTSRTPAGTRGWSTRRPARGHAGGGRGARAGLRGPNAAAGLRGPNVAVVVHGLTGSTHSVQALGDALADAGFEVRVPLLPGHGTSLDDLETTGWSDWLRAVRDEYDAARAGGEPVVLVGLSMGGSLVCRVAADANPAALVVINPYVDPPAEVARATMREVVAQGFTRYAGIGGDIADESVVEDAYDALPLRSLLSLAEGLDDLLPRLGAIACPVLLLSSRVDHVVHPVSGDMLAERVAGPVERVWLERSFHVATLDHDRDEIAQRTVAFALAHLRSQPMSGPRLTSDDVLHVARLARLELTDEEVDRYAEQLSTVLAHAADVAALDTAGVPPTAHPLPLENVFRGDAVVPSLDRDEVLAEAPDTEAGLFRVPPILGIEP
ncbi:MAG: Asp-tRNA(Asn)/Glu-tRNA(Gln) amidotransferase subunit GatC [Acidimicrobiales bacterium]